MKKNRHIPRWFEYSWVAIIAFLFFSTAAYIVDLELLAPLVILLIYRKWREQRK